MRAPCVQEPATSSPQRHASVWLCPRPAKQGQLTGATRSVCTPEVSWGTVWETVDNGFSWTQRRWGLVYIKISTNSPRGTSRCVLPQNLIVGGVRVAHDAEGCSEVPREGAGAGGTCVEHHQSGVGLCASWRSSAAASASWPSKSKAKGSLLHVHTRQRGGGLCSIGTTPPPPPLLPLYISRFGIFFWFGPN